MQKWLVGYRSIAHVAYRGHYLRMIRQLRLIVAFLLLGGCERDGGVIGNYRLPGVQGQFVIEDDRRTRPLTSARHSVFHVLGNDRHLIFQGVGGRKPEIAMLNNETLLVKYCGGTVEKTEGFTENEEGILYYRLIQPVVSSGLTVQGRPVC